VSFGRNSKFWVRISSTFSVLRPLYFVRFTSTRVLRNLYVDSCISTSVVQILYSELCTSTRLLRPLYFEFLSNLDFLLVEKHMSKYSFGRNKVVTKKSK